MEIRCEQCETTCDLSRRSIRRNKRKNDGEFICHQCKISDPTYKSKISKILAARNKSEKHKAITSKKIKEHWDGEYLRI